MLERISRKMFFITAILLACGLTISFLSSSNSAFADKTTAPNENASGTVSLLVNPSISLRIVIDSIVKDPTPAEDEPNAMFIELAPNMKSEGRFSALVATNRDYILQVNGLDGDTTMAHDSDSTYFIPSTADDGCTVESGANCWGLVAWSNDYVNPPQPAYKAIPSVATEFFRGTGPVSGEKETRFEVGVSTSPNIVAGDYKGKLVITASNI